MYFAIVNLSSSFLDQTTLSYRILKYRTNRLKAKLLHPPPPPPPTIHTCPKKINTHTHLSRKSLHQRGETCLKMSLKTSESKACHENRKPISYDYSYLLTLSRKRSYFLKLCSYCMFIWSSHDLQRQLSISLKQLQ